jgi:hypothetical protein
MSAYIGTFVQSLSDTAEHAVSDVENGYGGLDGIGLALSGMPEMQAIRFVLADLPESVWQSLPLSVREWVYNGPIDF